MSNTENPLPEIRLQPDDANEDVLPSSSPRALSTVFPPGTHPTATDTVDASIFSNESVSRASTPSENTRKYYLEEDDDD